MHEVKFDGYRMQLRVEGGIVALRTRKGLDWTTRFPEIANAGASLPDCILDGEICAVDKKSVPDFAGLLEALSSKKTGKLIYFAFDILWGAGEDLRPFPQDGRKRVLGDMIGRLGKKLRERIRYVEQFSGDGRSAWSSAQELGLEGIVSKRLDRPYKSGRVGYWTKTKCRLSEDVVIGGWSGEGALRSLMVGAYRGSEFVYVGNVGTGFNARNLPALLAALKKHALHTSPFKGRNAPKKAKDVTWTRPDIVCEVAFASWTRDGLLRQASFKGLREDISATDVKLDKPA